VIVFPKLMDFMLQGYSWEFIVQLTNNLLVFFLFIVAPCIVIYVDFTHQQMHFFILKKP